jgi:hypothetical protein
VTNAGRILDVPTGKAGPQDAVLPGFKVALQITNIMAQSDDVLVCSGATKTVVKRVQSLESHSVSSVVLYIWTEKLRWLRAFDALLFFILPEDHYQYGMYDTVRTNTVVEYS